MLDERVAGLYGTAGLERLLADQKEKFLPQIVAKRDKLVEKRDALNEEIAAAGQAIKEIVEGRVTDYVLRKPRKMGAE